MSFYVRSYNIEKLYYWSKNIYQTYFKKGIPWNIDREKLLTLPKISLGYELGKFLDKHNFRVEPKLENHDVFHVLTNCGTSVPDEIALQYYLAANGKMSPYLFMVILTGTVCYPERWSLFLQFFFRGRNASQFYDLNYEELLETPTNLIRSKYSIG